MFGPARGVIVVVIGLSLLTVEGYLVFVREPGVPAAGWGIESFVVSPSGDDPHIAQTMVMKAAGLHRLEVWPVSSKQVIDGNVLFLLRDITETENGPIVVRRRVSARLVSQEDSYTLEFPPILESAGVRYRLEIRMAEVPLEALGFMAVRGRHYRDGVLSNGSRALWANLKFRASATRATVFQRLVRHGRNGQWFPGPVSLLALWGLLHLAFGIVLVQISKADSTIGISDTQAYS